MRYKIEFTCELPFSNFTPWFTANDELNHTNFEYIEELDVIPVDEQRKE